MSKEIAVLGDPELVDALRLAGVRRTLALRAGSEAAAAITEALREWLAADEVGLVVVGADHAALAREVVGEFRRGRRLAPVIVEVPAGAGAGPADAAAYYQRLGREYLGLEIVLQRTGASTEVAGAATE